jgi:hypothetical protein
MAACPAHIDSVYTFRESSESVVKNRHVTAYFNYPFQGANLSPRSLGWMVAVAAEVRLLSHFASNSFCETISAAINIF